MSASAAALRVLGVDPGSHLTGYGVVEMRAGAMECVDCGTISGGDGDMPDRLLAVYAGMEEVLRAFRPAFVAIENAFLGRNVRTLASMSQTRGVLILAARRADLPVFEYTPREVKQSVAGNGGASKTQIAYMVRSMLELADVEMPSDVTDGLAVALCHLHRNGTGRP